MDVNFVHKKEMPKEGKFFFGGIYVWKDTHLKIYYGYKNAKFQFQ